MSTKAKYNVLMMRDNTPVRRYRLSPVWLKLALYFLLLLLCVAGAGGYFGLKFWEENRVLREDHSATLRELREAHIELERLKNIEQMLKSSAAQEAAGQSTPGEAPKAPPAPPQPPVDLSRIFTRTDVQQVRVDNMQARINGERHVQVVFNLNNLQTEDAIAGVASLAVVTNDGKDKLPQLNQNDLIFQIQRFKQISTSFGLPAGLTRGEVFGLRLVIKNNEGQVLFSDIYPLARILS
ncbi:hypothetical protein [Desulfocurvus sp.]|jgi:hypothetical protein|uniref:hypothetical protein n=1 Tax=Desulfocurvus sp. TaxID=2871698 RepID=UPI0025B85F29|nr:hypothetical protein [Desulfocurvus sp.]MCK9239131.1 hypothetical protein [Desulfocurvus sp.]